MRMCVRVCESNVGSTDLLHGGEIILILLILLLLALLRLRLRERTLRRCVGCQNFLHVL